jgi:hypothetical protein
MADTQPPEPRISESLETIRKDFEQATAAFAREGMPEAGKKTRSGVSQALLAAREAARYAEAPDEVQRLISACKTLSLYSRSYLEKHVQGSGDLFKKAEEVRGILDKVEQLDRHLDEIERTRSFSDAAAKDRVRVIQNILNDMGDLVAKLNFGPYQKVMEPFVKVYERTFRTVADNAEIIVKYEYGTMGRYRFTPSGEIVEAAQAAPAPPPPPPEAVDPLEERKKAARHVLRRQIFAWQRASIEMIEQRRRKMVGGVEQPGLYYRTLALVESLEVRALEREQYELGDRMGEIKFAVSQRLEAVDQEYDRLIASLHGNRSAERITEILRAFDDEGGLFDRWWEAALAAERLRAREASLAAMLEEYPESDSGGEGAARRAQVEREAASARSRLPAAEAKAAAVEGELDRLLEGITFEFPEKANPPLTSAEEKEVRRAEALLGGSAGARSEGATGAAPAPVYPRLLVPAPHSAEEREARANEMLFASAYGSDAGSMAERMEARYSPSGLLLALKPGNGAGTSGTEEKGGFAIPKGPVDVPPGRKAGLVAAVREINKVLEKKKIDAEKLVEKYEKGQIDHEEFQKKYKKLFKGALKKKPLTNAVAALLGEPKERAEKQLIALFLAYMGYELGKFGADLAAGKKASFQGEVTVKGVKIGAGAKVEPDETGKSFEIGGAVKVPVDRVILEAAGGVSREEGKYGYRVKGGVDLKLTKAITVGVGGGASRKPGERAGWEMGGKLKLTFKRRPGGGYDTVPSGPLPAATGGQPLPPVARKVYERFFGADLGQVRVHTGSGAGSHARRMGAEAFTMGSHVFFAPGRYRPETPAGRELLAHELTHVVQQTGAGAAPVVRRRPEGGAGSAAAQPTMATVEGTGVASFTVGDLETRVSSALGGPIPSDVVEDVLELEPEVVERAEQILARHDPRILLVPRELDLVHCTVNLDAMMNREEKIETWAAAVAQAVRDAVRPAPPVSSQEASEEREAVRAAREWREVFDGSQRSWTRESDSGGSAVEHLGVDSRAGRRVGQPGTTPIAIARQTGASGARQGAAPQEEEGETLGEIIAHTILMSPPLLADQASSSAEEVGKHLAGKQPGDPYFDRMYEVYSGLAGLMLDLRRMPKGRKTTEKQRRRWNELAQKWGGIENDLIASNKARAKRHLEKARRNAERWRLEMLYTYRDIYNAGDEPEDVDIGSGSLKNLVETTKDLLAGINEADAQVSGRSVTPLIPVMDKTLSLVKLINGWKVTSGLAAESQSDLAALINAWNLSTTALGLAGFGKFLPFFGHIGPLLDGISKGYGRLVGQLRRKNRLWWKARKIMGKELPHPAAMPGGKPVFSYMKKVFDASGPLSGRPSESVVDFFYENRKMFDAVAKEVMGKKWATVPTKSSWLVLTKVDPDKLNQYVYYNREMIWRLIYGRDMEFPD